MSPGSAATCHDIVLTAEAVMGATNLWDLNEANHNFKTIPSAVAKFQCPLVFVKRNILRYIAALYFVIRI